MSSAIISPAQPEQILKGLGKLWTSLGEEEKHHGKPTVLRACAMTLIVATDESDVGFAASQTISELMHAHPARGVVLAVSPDAENDVQARVLAQCWKPFGKAQQICCEQIEITVRPGSWPDIGPTLAGLTAADLPVIVWCRHKAALNKDATTPQKVGLEAILGLASKVIIDTKDMDPVEAIELLTKWRSQGRIAADLEWTRLTPWREPLAQRFDEHDCAGRIAQFEAVEIEHTGERPPISALYMAGWLAGAFQPKAQFRSVSSELLGLHRVILRSPEETIEFERTGSACAVLRSSNCRERKYTFGQPDDARLMTEELSIMGTDPSFRQALAKARELVA